MWINISILKLNFQQKTWTVWPHYWMWNKSRRKKFYAGNRTFLSVTNAHTDSIHYENIAFETNNFLAPVWFCLVSQEQFQRYSEQLMQVWSKIQPYMDQPDVEDLPEWECFSKVLQWQIPWPDAVGQLRLRLLGTLTHFSSLSALVYLL